MHISRVEIYGFRGITRGSFSLTPDCVFVGPNGCGKSTLVDAIALVLGRGRLVRTLTEHDFTGSNPRPADRFRVLVTLAGFPTNDPARHTGWFREGRAVPKWIDATGVVHQEPGSDRALCAQIGVVGRFDHEDLSVETIRYFHDADDADSVDPFLSDGLVEEVPGHLLNDVGFFVLLARRTWEGMVSFNSELFRRTLLEASGFPSAEILQHRDALREPTQPVERSPALGALVESLTSRIKKLLPGAPSLRLRLTSGDSDGVLHALQSHYSSGTGSLPVGRHGVGLLSLQSFLLLLEVAKCRREKGRSVILALEEPELHLAPGLSARLVSEARTLADQVICTTHSPRVASIFQPDRVRIMTQTAAETTAPPLLAKPLDFNATNVERKLFAQHRGRFVEAVMQPVVLVPEGRFDCEWLERLACAGEDRQKLAPFGSVLGLVPTEKAAVVRTLTAVRTVRQDVVALVDGDDAGDGYVTDLRTAAALPTVIMQWPFGKVMEDVVGWILSADEAGALAPLKEELSGRWPFNSLDDLVSLLKTENEPRKGIAGLKEDIVVHDVIARVIQERPLCQARCGALLDAVVAAATRIEHDGVEVPGGDPLLRRLTLA